MNGAILPFFPVPVESETVYSIICRFKTRSGFSNSTICKMLTGQQSATPLLASYSDHFPHISKVVSEKHPLKDPWIIVRKHTVLSYFMYFNSRECRSTWENNLNFANADTKSQSALKGLCKSTSTHPRYCPTCAKEDDRALGFSYFRREHQLPWIAVCWHHGDKLSHGCRVCGTYPIKTTGLHMAGRCDCIGGIIDLPAFTSLPDNHIALLWLAQESAYMLDSRQPHSGDYYSGLRACAKEKGFDVGSPEKLNRLAKLIENRFGKELLDWLEIGIWRNGAAAEWIKRFLVRKLHPENRKSTLHYLLIIGALFPTVKAFENVALHHMQSNDESKYPKIFLRFESLQNVLQAHRNAILKYLDSDPHQRSCDISTSFRWLKQYDPEWLLKNCPDLNIKVFCGTYFWPPEWEERDQKAVETVKALVETELKSISKPERITILRMYKEVKIAASIYSRYKDKYPLFEEAIARYSESSQKFHRRLIEWAIEQSRLTNQEITLENIHKTSGLSLNLVKKHGQHIFEILASSTDQQTFTKLVEPVKAVQMGLFD